MDWKFLHNKYVIVGLLIVFGLLLLTNVYYGKRYFENEEEVLNFPWELEDESVLLGGVETTDVALPNIVVDVKGEVKRPGIYEVEEGKRVYDVILEAGGFTEEAEERALNLAEKCYDEMVIYVPTVALDGEESDVFKFQEHLSTSSEQNGKIRINKATVEELVTLPGIGPAKAESIAQYISDHGPFRQIEDLVQVPGIGEKTMESLRDHLIVP